MIERVSRDIRGRVERLGSFLRRKKSTGTELPHCIDDDYSLLYYVDPYLHGLMDQESFRSLQASLQKSNSSGAEIVDIAAGRNFLRGLLFLNSAKTTAIDPAYKWYDHEAKDPFAPIPYPCGVFGGKAARGDVDIHG